MQRGVHGRLMDNSTSVREAAVELLGRFVLSRPQLTEQYYDMLIERILVSCPVGTHCVVRSYNSHTNCTSMDEPRVQWNYTMLCHHNVDLFMCQFSAQLYACRAHCLILFTYPAASDQCVNALKLSSHSTIVL